MSARGLGDLPDPAKEAEKCRDFLSTYNDDIGGAKYMEQLQAIADRDSKVLIIELDDILSFKNDMEFVSNIQRNTVRYVKYFEEEADKLMPRPTVQYIAHDVFDVLESQRMASLQRAAEKGLEVPRTSGLPSALLRRYEVLIYPLSSAKPCKLREIRAEDIGHLVVIKGLITRASNVRPRGTVCTYTCEVCGCEIFQEIVGPSFMPVLKCESKRCQENKNPGKLTLQTRGSKFVKYQELRLQELPDQLPMGHVPRSLILHCSGELCRLAGPGDIVTISGVFLAVKYSGYKAITAGLQADTYLDVFRIEKHKLNFADMLLVDAHQQMVREIARDVDPYSRLASSIAPEIFGHEDVKKALLLQLVGGVTRDMADGMRIRGDINVLLVGDPGVAKSQLLRYISSVAPRGVYTTGKGSSGVGLTAALVKDAMTSEFALEAGALVLADRGICCIDEFDKMNEQDRAGIHEVMEQQTVSIAKAGITATLNARTSVLAAANPLYGRYNTRKSISENIDLPNSLLSRFDLVFLLLDKSDPAKDLALSKHVLHVHKHQRQPALPDSKSGLPSVLPPEVFKQYIAYARKFSPSIPAELSDYIVEAYVNMRNESMASSQNKGGQLDQAVMTPRQLLSILRISQGLARLRLDGQVSAQDVDEAIRLTHESKRSLLDALYGGAGGGQEEDAMSRIFNFIKDMAEKSPSIEFSRLESVVVHNGYTMMQLRRCLESYEAMGVLSLNDQRTTITLVN